MKKRGVARKAQVSIFMVMAALIIVAGIFYFYYPKSSVPLEVVPPELVPIKSYVEECIKSIAEDGLQTIGLSGGYINVPDSIKKDPRKYLSIFPSSGFLIPYWWHEGIDSMPPEDYIKDQLKNHIKNELIGCINNFEPFMQTFEIEELKEPAVEVSFNEEDTTVKVKYPIEVTSKSKEFKALIGNFQYNAPIRFKKAYELAKLIMERENKDFFLEKKTIDLYSMSTEIPTTDIEARCTTKIWQLINIKNELKKMLKFNLPYIRIKGTDYTPNLYVPSPDGKDTYSQSYYQQHYVWEISKDAKKRFGNMKVEFVYDDWPMELYARPSQNGILKSNSQKGTDLLKFFCLHIWHFTYDVKYPVLVTIFDQETKKNAKYQFNFAFKVDIDHNRPNKETRGSTLLESVDDASSEEFCNDVENQITVYTVDNSTGEDINDVNLTFACGRFYCDLGQSEWLSFGAAAGITKRLPFCFNGVMKGSKEGYLDTSAFVQTDVDARSYILFLNPVKEFNNYKVVKHLFSNPSQEEELNPNEKASIFIRSNKTGFDSFAFYPKEASFPLKLPSGRDEVYEVAVYVADEENFVSGYVGNWKVSKDDLANANEIIFHTVYSGSRNEDDIEQFISDIETNSKKVPAPELK